MDQDQTAPKGAVWSGFIVFASMIQNEIDLHLNICSRRNKQTTFSGQK